MAKIKSKKRRIIRAHRSSTITFLKAIGLFAGALGNGAWVTGKASYSAIYWLLNVKGWGKKNLDIPDNTEIEKDVKKIDTLKKKAKSKIKTPAEYSKLNVIDKVKGEFNNFHSRLLDESMIVLIAGRRGSGKSTLAFRLMENIHAKTKRPCFVLGVKQELIPRWITEVDSVEDVANEGIVLVDEGAISFGSRNSMSKKNIELGKLMAIARHKDLTLLLVTQNTGMIDKNVLNLSDTILLKEGSLLQKEMERPVMRKFYEIAQDKFKAISSNERKKHVYVFDGDFEGFVSSSLPSFWSDKISKSRA